MLYHITAHDSSLVPTLSPAATTAALAQFVSASLFAPPARPNLVLPAPIFHIDDAPAAYTRTCLNRQHWAALLAGYPDPAPVHQILGALEHGLRLGYTGPFETTTRTSVRNLPLDAAGLAHLRTEIAARVAAGSLLPASAADHLVCSPIGVVPKDGGRKLRTIHHLSYPRRGGPSVNDGIAAGFSTLAYEGLDRVLALVGLHKGAKLWKSDLSDAFRQFAVSDRDSRLLAFSLDGSCYREAVLPFGCASSPTLFNMFAEAIHWIVESITGQPHSHYLDDSFGAVVDGDSSTPVRAMAATCHALGMALSAKKTHFDVTELEILGVLIDSERQTASLTEERRLKVRERLHAVLDAGTASLRDLQEIAGTLQFLTAVIPHGRAFMRRIHDAGGKLHSAPPNQRRHLPKEARRDLQWWWDVLEDWNGRPLRVPEITHYVHLWTDACPRGLGGHLGPADSATEAYWLHVPRRHRQKPIHFLEALAVLRGLELLCGEVAAGGNLVLHIDNEAVRYSLLSGSSRDPLLQTVVRAIFSWAAARHITLLPVRVSSEDNLLADVLSRRDLHRAERKWPLLRQRLSLRGSSQPRWRNPRSTSSSSSSSSSPNWPRSSLACAPFRPRRPRSPADATASTSPLPATAVSARQPAPSYAPAPPRPVIPSRGPLRPDHKRAASGRTRPSAREHRRRDTDLASARTRLPPTRTTTPTPSSPAQTVRRPTAPAARHGAGRRLSLKRRFRRTRVWHTLRGAARTAMRLRLHQFLLNTAPRSHRCNGNLASCARLVCQAAKLSSLRSRAAALHRPTALQMGVEANAQQIFPIKTPAK